MASNSPSNSNKDRVHLLDLAAAAVSCTVTASWQIRQLVQAQNARLKPDGSFVTDADFTAQAVIVQAIQQVSADLLFVGEESPAEMAQHIEKLEKTDDTGDDVLRRTRRELEILYQRRDQQADEVVACKLPLAEGSPLPFEQADVVDSLQDDESLVVDSSRISVIVDPLDGTKSYTKGETEAVSILICITLDGEPYFGVVGKPFGYPGLPSILESGCTTIYGGNLLKNVYCAGQAAPLKRPVVSAQPRAVISQSRSSGVVQDFCIHLGSTGLIHPEPLLVSGAGEKSLRLVLQRMDEALWFYPKGGTSVWDVAAPDALLRVLGGKITDKYGEPLDYRRSRDLAENKDGVVACIDPDLHRKCIELFQKDDWLQRK